MNLQFSAGWPALFFAALLAVLLFGAFFGRPLFRALGAWWRGLDSRQVGGALDGGRERPTGEELPPAAPREAQPRHALIEPKERVLHRSPPHVEHQTGHGSKAG